MKCTIGIDFEYDPEKTSPALLADAVMRVFWPAAWKEHNVERFERQGIYLGETNADRNDIGEIRPVTLAEEKS